MSRSCSFRFMSAIRFTFRLRDNSSGEERSESWPGRGETEKERLAFSLGRDLFWYRVEMKSNITFVSNKINQ